MSDDYSRRGFLHSATAAALAAMFAGKVTVDGASGNQTHAPEFDYRRICWGMSQDEVVAAEDSDVHLRMPAVVMYRHSLDQVPLTLTYQFAMQGNDAVCAAAVLLTDLTSNKLYIDFGTSSNPASRLEDAKFDYERIKQILMLEYGTPVVQDLLYQDEELVSELLRDSEGMQQKQGAHWPSGIAETMGDLQVLSHDESTIRSLMLHTLWDTPRTSISLRLIPMVFGGVMLMVRFDSRELSRLLPGHPDYQDLG